MPEHKLALVIPVKDDLGSLTILIQQIQNAFVGLNVKLKLYIVDDCSTTPLKRKDFESSLNLKILRNDYNQGHQRSITTGLRNLDSSWGADYVAILDGDGEDDPEHLPLLLRKLIQEQSASGVIAIRGLRHSTHAFMFFYRFFKLLFWFLTGKKFGSGNFMMFPISSVQKLLKLPGHNLSLVAAAMRNLDHLTFMRLDRKQRIDGSSKMTIIKLLDHAFSIFSVFADLILIRLLIYATISMLFLFLGVASVFTLKILGIFELVAGISTSILLQFISISILFLNFALFSLISIFLLKRTEAK